MRWITIHRREGKVAQNAFLNYQSNHKGKGELSGSRHQKCYIYIATFEKQKTPICPLTIGYYTWDLCHHYSYFVL